MTCSQCIGHVVFEAVNPCYGSGGGFLKYDYIQKAKADNPQVPNPFLLTAKLLNGRVPLLETA